MAARFFVSFGANTRDRGGGRKLLSNRGGDDAGLPAYTFLSAL